MIGSLIFCGLSVESLKMWYTLVSELREKEHGGINCMLSIYLLEPSFTSIYLFILLTYVLGKEESRTPLEFKVRRLTHLDSQSHADIVFLNTLKNNYKKSII